MPEFPSASFIQHGLSNCMCDVLVYNADGGFTQHKFKCGYSIIEPGAYSQGSQSTVNSNNASVRFTVDFVCVHHIVTENIGCRLNKIVLVKDWLLREDFRFCTAW